MGNPITAVAGVSNNFACHRGLKIAESIRRRRGPILHLTVACGLVDGTQRCVGPKDRSVAIRLLHGLLLLRDLQDVVGRWRGKSVIDDQDSYRLSLRCRDSES